jgi:hypothetical protein
MKTFPIPRTHWQSTVPHMIKANQALWKMVLLPTGGAEIRPDGTITGHDPAATQRTAQLQAYDRKLARGMSGDPAGQQNEARHKK